jgi:hypothetical protein
MGIFDVEPLRRQALPGEDLAKIQAEVESAEQPDLPFEVDPDLPLLAHKWSSNSQVKQQTSIDYGSFAVYSVC